MATQTETAAVTLGDLEAFLLERGIPLEDVRGVDIVAERRGARSAQLMLRVVRYLHDESGSRFAVRMPDASVQVAAEAILFPLTRLLETRTSPDGHLPLAYDWGLADQPTPEEAEVLLEQDEKDRRMDCRVQFSELEEKGDGEDRFVLVHGPWNRRLKQKVEAHRERN